MTKKAIVLISGGLDSTTCLAIACVQGFECYTLAFDYGQKHRCELVAAEAISKKYGAKLPATSSNIWNGIGRGDMRDRIGRRAGQELHIPDRQAFAELEEPGFRQHVLPGQALAQEIDV